MPRSKKKDTTDGMVKQFAGLTINSADSDSDSDSEHVVCLATQWSAYIQKGSLHDFQRLCADLGLSGDLGSKTKCRKELKSINVNIKQFLECENKPEDVKFFKNRYVLMQYTRKTHSYFPRRKLAKGDPLRALLKDMY
ncbi:hypothetical protein ACHAPT_010010 [Fusarium lateritium]